MRRTLAAAIAVFACTLAVSACGNDDGVEESRIIGESLTVYSSLPLTGPQAAVSKDIVLAEKLALQEAKGRAGLYDVSFVSLDNADPETGEWDENKVAANARKAVQDRQTIAYLGELDPGSSGISLPILNEGGILMVGPRDTYGGLTERGGPGEPDNYYPSGRRTFTRVVPGGDAEAGAMVGRLRADGVERLVIADDRTRSGTGLGDRIEALAGERGIDVERLRLDPDRGVPSLARVRGADALLYTGAAGDFAAEVLREAAGSDPALRLYGTDDLTLAPPAGSAAKRLVATGVDPVADPGFERRFAAAFGHQPDRNAVLGYRAMRLVLAAVAQTGKQAASRRAVTARALALGREPRSRFGLYRVRGTGLVRVGPAL